jgi:predicted lipoprotein
MGVGSRWGHVGSWLLAAGLLGASLVRPWACTEDPGEGTPDDEVLDALAAVGPNVVLPALGRAGGAAETLVAATEDWEASFATGAGGDDGARAAARTAWIDAMAAWQELEVMQIGPAASSIGEAIAAEDLRDEVYSWPTVNPCLVDRTTVSGDYAAGSYLEQASVDAYGLDALEVLLFAPDDENGCPPHIDINADGTWDALGVDGVKERRAAYAVVVATGVRDVIAELEAIWDPSGEDFAGALAAPGSAASPYAGANEALTAVLHALFYVETVTKDKKLARPLGLTPDCSESQCLLEVESPFAAVSQRWIGVNLAAFRTLFDGGEGAGMDDLLVSLGHGATADAMHVALDAADAAAAAVDVPIDEGAEAEDPRVLALHAAVDGVTDLLKGDVTTLLSLSLPDEAAGDND